MDKFTLGTSGTVINRASDVPARMIFRWADLDAFTQGYVEALFASLSVDLVANWLENVDPYRSPGFRDLAPETLAAILKDCERGANFYAGKPGAVDGRDFYTRRQRGDFLRFPLTADLTPISITLGDDGKVYLRPQTKTAEGGEG